MAKTNGYEIGRGSYTNTTDDRLDRWYIENPNARYVDRRGCGYHTKKAADEAAKLLPHADTAEPYYN